MEDAAKLQKEKYYKEQKMIVCKHAKNSKMQHYYEAQKNARTNSEETWNFLFMEQSTNQVLLILALPSSHSTNLLKATS